MDELKMVADTLTEERPASAEVTAHARRRLSSEIGSRRGPFRRLRSGLPTTRRFRVGLVAGIAVVAVAASGTAQYVRTRPLYHLEPLAGQSGPAYNFLLAAADAKAGRTSTGRLWHVESEHGHTVVVRSLRHPEVRYAVQISAGKHSISAKRVNGIQPGVDSEGWSDETPVIRPAGARDRAAWQADGKPDARALGLDAPMEPQRGPIGREGAQLDFGVDVASKLPTDPARLRVWLLNYATKFDHKRLQNPDLYLFTHATSLLIDRVVSDRVRVATYRILASLSGVRTLKATDPAGRPGQAVAMRQTTTDYGTIDWELFIDTSTGQLTASQGVVVGPGVKKLISSPEPGSTSKVRVPSRS